MKKTFFILAASLLLALAFHAAAQIPRTLSYQGVLTDNAGKPRPDGNYSFTFRLYTSPTGGTAIWSESKNLSVKNGLFSTVLGEQPPFGAAVKFDKQYWLGIQVGTESELSPRIALTSVGYSFSSLRADTASVSVASLADTTWRHSGANIYRLNGNVGIGTPSPGEKVTVYGNMQLQNQNPRFYIADFVGTGYIGTDNNQTILIAPNGEAHVKISASETKVYNSNFMVQNQNPRIFIADNLGTGYIGTDNNQTILVAPNGEEHMKISTSETKVYNSNFMVQNQNPRIFIADNLDTGYIGTDNSQNFIIAPAMTEGIRITRDGRLEVAGRTKTCVLEITGGCDLAEPFEISENQPIPKGALLIIDKENPGQLKLSDQAYDKRVAGVVSGAGGINPGLTLTQQGIMQGGQNVALSGRVYALATAANGPIKPGDLLTTSDIPGHAMKATDRERWDGAIIGKAMSSLENGEGLVLVLVNLQ